MDRYEPQSPCPYCFESSGYEARVHPATWADPSWAEPDPTRPCSECNGTGMVPAHVAGPDDWLSEWSADFHSDEWAAAAEQVA
jgi:hypothetical protein